MTVRKTGTVVLLLLGTFFLHAQDIKNIPLKNEKSADPLKNCYISLVKDDRADTSDIGSIKITGLFGKKTQRLNLQNGARTAIAQYIHANVQQDTSAGPIVMHISQLKLQESGTSGLKVENELTMGLVFYLDTTKLIAYTGGGSTESMGDPAKLIEELIRGNIGSMLHQFDQWWATNKGFYAAIRTKPTIKVEVAFDPDSDNADIISYSRQRPLTLDDFRGKPDDMSTAAAVTYSILIMKYSSVRTMTNEILVDVSVLANFNKTKSWCRPEHRNEETLRHEQGHFDISAIKACELVDTIRNFHFSVDNFPRELDRLQRLKQKELDDLQDQYDRDTGHGRGPQAQEKWNQLIRQKLGNSSCFKS